MGRLFAGKVGPLCPEAQTSLIELSKIFSELAEYHERMDSDKTAKDKAAKMVQGRGFASEGKMDAVLDKIRQGMATQDDEEDAIHQPAGGRRSVLNTFMGKEK